jgi:hypothetical protein
MTEDNNALTSPIIEIQQEPNKKANIVLDMSSYDLFETCEARYDFRHNHNKSVDISKKSVALDIGGIMHEGLEVYFKLLAEGQHFNDRLHACIRKIQEVSSNPEISNSEPEDINQLINSVEQSCDYWRYEDEMMDIIEVERPFAYILYEDAYVRLISTGKIDLLVNLPAFQNSPPYSKLPYDHKSFRRDFEVPELSNQFMNYCTATKSLYLRVNRVGLQKTLEPNEKFQRVVLSYTKEQLEEWKDNVINMLLTNYLTCVSIDRWPTRYTSCFKFNRKCEYYNVCRTPGREEKLKMLEDTFVTVSPWDVTHSFTKGSKK